MKRELRITEDGSHTLFVGELGEHYHSIHGAVTESQHIFINAGFNNCKKQHIRVLEVGMGTGLNVWLTAREAAAANRTVFYHAIEKYPLTEDEFMMLNYPSLMGAGSTFSLHEIHTSPYQSPVPLSPLFTLYKERTDLTATTASGPFDLIYFDAFAPEVQPELWSDAIFGHLFGLTAPEGILTTYSSKGSVNRSLKRAGYQTEKLPGPPGKREILRARRTE